MGEAWHAHVLVPRECSPDNQLQSLQTIGMEGTGGLRCAPLPQPTQCVVGAFSGICCPITSLVASIAIRNAGGARGCLNCAWSLGTLGGRGWAPAGWCGVCTQRRDPTPPAPHHLPAAGACSERPTPRRETEPRREVGRVQWLGPCPVDLGWVLQALVTQTFHQLSCS